MRKAQALWRPDRSRPRKVCRARVCRFKRLRTFTSIDDSCRWMKDCVLAVHRGAWWVVMTARPSVMILITPCNAAGVTYYDRGSQRTPKRPGLNLCTQSFVFASSSRRITRAKSIAPDGGAALCLAALGAASDPLARLRLVLYRTSSLTQVVHQAERFRRAS